MAIDALQGKIKTCMEYVSPLKNMDPSVKTTRKNTFLKKHYSQQFLSHLYATISIGLLASAAAFMKKNRYCSIALSVLGAACSAYWYNRANDPTNLMKHAFSMMESSSDKENMEKKVIEAIRKGAHIDYREGDKDVLQQAVRNNLVSVVQRLGKIGYNFTMSTSIAAARNLEMVQTLVAYHCPKYMDVHFYRLERFLGTSSMMKETIKIVDYLIKQEGTLQRMPKDCDREKITQKLESILIEITYQDVQDEISHIINFLRKDPMFQSGK